MKEPEDQEVENLRAEWRRAKEEGAELVGDMTQDAARRAAEEIIRKRLGSVYTSRATMDDCLDRLMEWRTTAPLEARRAERAQVDDLLNEWEAAYPEDVFKPFTASDHPHVSPDRIAAEMGRHMAREMRKQLAALRQPDGAPGGA